MGDFELKGSQLYQQVPRRHRETSQKRKIKDTKEKRSKAGPLSSYLGSSILERNPVYGFVTHCSLMCSYIGKCEHFNECIYVNACVAIWVGCINL